MRDRPHGSSLPHDLGLEDSDRAQIGELIADGNGELRGDWSVAVDVYALYHFLELWDWFAAFGRTGPLEAIAEEMRQLVDA